MGFGRRTPKSPELSEAQLAEQAKLKKEKEAQEAKAADDKRISEQGLRGFRSLISEDEDGVDYRGKVKKMGSGSIRY